MRKLRTDSGRRAALSAQYVRYLVKKMKETGTPENITAVAESVHETLLKSIHCRPQQLNISEMSLRRILHKDLGITPYEIQ